MDARELVVYRVSATTSIIPSLDPHFQSSIIALKRNDLKVLLQDSPAEALVDKAIEFFVTSGSFDSAYSNGTQVLLKYAEFINDQNLSKIFEGVYSNSSHRINQILCAGGISEFFAMLYSQTKTDKVIEHTKLWLDFRNTINEKGHIYNDLDGLMEVDGIVKLEPVEVE